MTVYFVDTENMGGAWVRHVKDARPGDLFLLFYTNNSHAIDFASLKKITASKAKFECIPCYIGTNALDFQLLTTPTVYTVGFLGKCLDGGRQ